MRVADRCVQVRGGAGVTGDTIVEQVFREIRAFRIYQAGPSQQRPGQGLMSVGVTSLLVPRAGVEPALLSEPDFESGASTSSTTGALKRLLT